jgi:hypothetical protein
MLSRAGNEQSLADRRRTSRTGKFQSGVVAFNSRFSTMRCVVQNRTPHGAMLTVSNALSIPERFELRLEHENFRWCRIKWRRDYAVGIEFE